VIVGAIVIFFILFVRLTCSTNPGETRVEIILLDSSYLNWAELNRRRIRAFEEQHPDIRVRMVTESSPEKILTMIAGGITPDVFMLATEDIPDYGRRGVISDVDRFMREDPEFDVGEYFKEIVDAMRYRGKLYGLPDNLSPVLLFYNKDVFDRFGVEYPDGTWRWEEFLEACKKLTKDTDGDGRTDQYAFVSSWWRNRWPMYIWQNGGRVFTPERDRCLMDQPEAIEAIRWYYELTSKHHVAPAVGAQLENVAAQDASEWFKAGRVAMLAESRYAMARLRETPDLRWDVAPLPNQKQRATTFVAGGWAISATSKHPLAAWKLVKFLTGEVGAQMSMEAGRAICGYRPVAEKAVIHPGISPEHDVYFIEAVEYCWPSPFFAENRAVWDRAESELFLLSEGRSTPEKACREFARVFNEWFSAAKVEANSE
jgi:multiple sugar transport system substrate-binding protein